MKIKNVAALSLAGCAVVALGLGEMVTFADDASDKDIGMDLSKVVQHIVNVKIVDDSGSIGNASILKLAGNNLVGIETNNFVISQTGDDANTITNSNLSNILGGIKNKIEGGTASTILGGSGNVNNGNYSTILGGERNEINPQKDVNSDNSVIIGGKLSTIKGNHSVIVGGESNSVKGNNSTVIGNGSRVEGDSSVALGKNSTVNADNSFLWTDENLYGELDKSNVFVVRADHGMVVNTNQAHPFAKLTIGGPLVIHEGDVVCNANNKGVVKVVDGKEKNGNLKCFCSCDGNSYWHSLYGQGRCEGVCNAEERLPGCGSDVSSVSIENLESMAKNGKLCNEYSKPVTGEGAYFVDKTGKIHWTCQTDAGLTIACSK